MDDSKLAERIAEIDADTSAASKLQWAHYGKYLVGFDETRVVCAIAPAPEAPCEMFVMQFFEDAYTSMDAAQVEAEKAYTRAQTPQRSPIAEAMIPALENMLAVLRAGKPESAR